MNRITLEEECNTNSRHSTISTQARVACNKNLNHYNYEKFKLRKLWRSRDECQ